MLQERFEDAKAEFKHFVYRFAQTDSWLPAHPPKLTWNLHDLYFKLALLRTGEQAAAIAGNCGRR